MADSNITSNWVYKSFSEPPPPLDFTLPGLIQGTVGALVSPGGAGKSMLALQLGAQIAGGPDLLGLGPLTAGRVIYIPAEDPPIAVRHRLYALGHHLDPVARQRVAENLSVKSVLGEMPNLLDPSCLDSLMELARGSRLMVLDTLRRFHLEEENASGPMSAVIGAMERLADTTGCSVLFLHHASKSAALMGAGDQQQASRGSSVLVDNIRWQSFVAGMTAAEAETWGVSPAQRGYFVRFGVSKSNYGPPSDERWYRRHDGGVLLPAVLERQQQRQRPAQRADDDNW